MSCYRSHARLDEGMVQSNDQNPTREGNPTYEGTVTKEGRLSLPREVLQAGFEPGSRLYILVENDGALRLESRAQKAARLRSTISEQWRGAADESVVDELAADRRAAAARAEGAA